MRTILLLWAGTALLAQTSPPPQNPGPTYVSSSIVNAASTKVETLAPNTLATIYGKNLSYSTQAVTSEDLENGILPTTLIGTGVRVHIRGVAAQLLYVSPTQINFLIPSNLRAGEAELRVVHQSRSGPAAMIRLTAAAPALFQADPEVVVAARPDGSVVTRDARAAAGEVIILYATGLGDTAPMQAAGQIARSAAPVADRASFWIDLNGTRLPKENTLYVGVAPGFAGLYQINVRLPDTLERDPEIRIGFNEVSSPAGVRLPAGR